MNERLIDRLRRHIAARNLLDHPFYQDWRQGRLTIDDLRAYAGQYYHFEIRFPRFLSAIHSRCPDREVRQDILSNLWDEEHGERNHRALWLDFCAGTGLGSTEAETTSLQPGTLALLDTYTGICSTRSFQEGLAAVYAYEVQVPQIAAEKLAGLKNLYGIRALLIPSWSGGTSLRIGARFAATTRSATSGRTRPRPTRFP